MNDTPNDNDTPEVEAAEKPLKPAPPTPPEPPAPPEPGEVLTPPPVERAPLPEYRTEPGPPKSPPLAAVLAILFPGVGHLYVWAYERAFMIWATIALCVFLIVYGFWPFSILIAFVYFFAIFDAYREAQLYNLREENQELPEPRPDGQGRLMFGVFLAVVAAVVLADKLDLFDMDWVYDWWPVPVFLLGVYFIIAAIRDRFKAKREERAGEDEF
jgi:hypothetical protein